MTCKDPSITCCLSQSSKAQPQLSAVQIGRGERSVADVFPFGTQSSARHGGEHLQPHRLGMLREKAHEHKASLSYVGKNCWKQTIRPYLSPSEKNIRLSSCTYHSSCSKQPCSRGFQGQIPHRSTSGTSQTPGAHAEPRT